MSVSVAVTRDGYRAVLLGISISKLRFALPIMAFFGFGALAAGFDTHSLVLLTGLAGVVLFVWFYVNWASGSPAHNDVYVPVRYVFTSEGISHESDLGSGTIPWSRIRRWRLRAKHYLLYTDVVSFLLVPVDAVAPDGRGVFEALLAEKVGRARSR